MATTPAKPVAYGIAHRCAKVYYSATDQVRFVWRDNARRSTASIKAAEAGQCAHNQGRFWEYNALLFEAELGLGVDALKTYASRLGLDMETFNQCLDGNEMRRKVEFDMRRAGSMASAPPLPSG